MVCLLICDVSRFSVELDLPTIALLTSHRIIQLYYSITPSADQLDVLLFQNFILRKRFSPSTIPEGSQSVYSVVLDGPPAADVSLELEAADNFARLEYTVV